MPPFPSTLTRESRRLLRAHLGVVLAALVAGTLLTRFTIGSGDAAVAAYGQPVSEASLRRLQDQRRGWHRPDREGRLRESAGQPERKKR